MARKSFVLDTNVLLHNPAALDVFEDNEVVIPMTVIEELDDFKRNNDEVGRHARQVIRSLDRYREQGRLTEGVAINDKGGTVRVVWQREARDFGGLDMNKRDNLILSVAVDIQQQGGAVVFVSKDVDARLKADALGLTVVDFEKQKVDFDRLYSGWRKVACSADVVDGLYEQGAVDAPAEDLEPNEFVLLEDEANPKHSAPALFLDGDGKLHKLHHDEARMFGIAARNMEQTFAMELLLSTDVQLVTLVGKAGTGKTLLAVACGLHQVQVENKYDKLLVSRPVLPMGKDIGYLPGTKEEKLANWMQPIFDNLALLLSTGKGGGKGSGKGGGKDGKNGKAHSQGEMAKKVQALQDSGKVEMEALTYIRGRSIPQQFIVIDEAQNLTPHEVKTIISRAGEDTKIVLTGDPYQIDNPYLDASSNGLTYTVERMRGQKLFGHVTLTKSERSTLASIAAERL